MHGVLLSQMKKIVTKPNTTNFMEEPNGEALLQVEEPMERELVESLERQAFCSLAALWPDDSMLTLRCLCEHVLASEQRLRQKVHLAASVGLRVIVLCSDEAIRREQQIAVEEHRCRARLLVQMRLAHEQTLDRVEEIGEERADRASIASCEAITRGGLLAPFLWHEALMGVAPLQREEALSWHTLDVALHTSLDRAFVSQAEHNARIAFETGTLSEIASIASGVCSFLNQMCVSNLQRMHALQELEASCRASLHLDQQNAIHNVLVSAVHSEHVAALIPTLAAEMTERVEMGRVRVLDVPRVLVMMQERETRDAMAGRELIVRSAATNGMLERIHHWTGLRQLAAREERLRRVLTHTHEPSERLKVAAMMSMTTCFACALDSREKISCRMKSEASIIDMVMCSEPRRRTALREEEEDARRHDLLGADLWHSLRQSQLFHAEYDERDRLEDDWEMEAQNMETQMLQRMIWLTDAHLSHFLAARLGGGCGVFSESEKMFQLRLVEQEELPRSAANREEAARRSLLITAHLMELHAIGRTTIIGAWEMERVSFKWKHTSKRKVLLRTSALYTREALSRHALEEDEGRRRILEVEEPRAMDIIVLHWPRSYATARAVRALRDVQREGWMTLVTLWESYLLRILHDTERTEFARLNRARQVDRMITMGSSSRREIQLRQQQEFLVTLAEPHQRWQLEKRIDAHLVRTTESWLRMHAAHNEERERMNMLEEPCARWHVGQHQIQTAASVLMMRREAVERLHILSSQTDAEKHLQVGRALDFLWAHQLCLRRRISHDERHLAVCLEEMFRRNILEAVEKWVHQIDFMHMRSRITLYQEENLFRNQLAHVFREHVEEPMRRDRVASEQMSGFLWIVEGASVNRSNFLLFEQERLARTALLEHEADDWVTVGLTQMFRRSSIRQSGSVCFPSADAMRFKSKAEVLPSSLSFERSALTAIVSNRAWLETPINASLLEDAEMLLRLQILRHEDQSIRALRQFLSSRECGESSTPSKQKAPMEQHSSTMGVSMQASPHRPPVVHPCVQSPRLQPTMFAPPSRSSATTIIHIVTPTKPAGNIRAGQPSPRKPNVGSMVPW